MMLHGHSSGSTLSTRIREADSTATLLALLRNENTDPSRGGLDESRADLVLAAREKYSSDPLGWNAEVAAQFGVLMRAHPDTEVIADEGSASSAEDGAAISAVVAAPLAGLLSTEMCTSRAAMLGYQLATTMILFLVLVGSFVVKRPFGVFYILNVCLFALSLVPHTLNIVLAVLACVKRSTDQRKFLCTAQLYYLALHFIGLLGVAALIVYLAQLPKYVDEWCSKYAPSAPTAVGTNASHAGEASSSRCPSAGTSDYAWMLTGVAFAAICSCCLFLGVVEIGARIASKWTSLVQFAATDALSGLTGFGNNISTPPNSFASAPSDYAAMVERSLTVDMVVAVGRVDGLYTPLTGITTWMRSRLHLSSLCLALCRRDLEHFRDETSRDINESADKCCTVFTRRAAKLTELCEAFSRKKNSGWVIFGGLVLAYWVFDVVLAAVCWGTNSGSTCVVSNVVSIVINVFLALVVLILVLTGGGSSGGDFNIIDFGTFAFGGGYETPAEQGKSNFILAMIAPGMVIGAIILCICASLLRATC